MTMILLQETKKGAFFFLLLLFAVSPLFSECIVIEDMATVSILTPSLADRSTLKLRLDNGLEAYIISDPASEQSGAALSVEAGSWQDLEEFPGTAHFLEHMLFLGTEKYPEESEYHTFITEHGGMTNAYTADDHTAFMFSVNSDHFEKALDRFSHFFIDPLFNVSGIDREMHAVDQEFSQNAENDNYKVLHIFKELGNPDHPDKKFTHGNLETLKGFSRELLYKWYLDHYSANVMRLVMYSPLSLEELRRLAVEKFGGIENRNSQPLKVSETIFSKEYDGYIIYAEPAKDIRRLSLNWELPSRFVNMEESRPADMVAHILGHEGSESLLAQLKRENLVNGLSAGGATIGKNNMLFALTISLTEQGIMDVDTVIERCFQAIANLRSKKVPQYIFDESQKMSRLNYQYQSRMQVFDTVKLHARDMMLEPLETYPKIAFIPQYFDQEATDELVGYLTPERCHMTLTAKQQLTGEEYDFREPWMGMQYAVKAIDQKKLEGWSHIAPHSAIGLPKPNNLIPEDLSILNPPSEEFPVPHVIIDDDFGKIYAVPDSIYGVPRVSWSIHINTPSISVKDPKSIVLGDIYIESVEEALNSFTYRAYLAGLSYSIKRTNSGIMIAIEGYSEKAHILLQEIFAQLHPVLSEDKFSIYKRSLLLEYKNFYRELSLLQGIETIKSSTYKDYITEEQKTQAITGVVYDEFISFANKIYDEVYIEGMLCGNIIDEQAQGVSGQLKNAIVSSSYLPERHPKKEVLSLPEDSGPFFTVIDTKCQGNATLLLVDEGRFSFKRRAAQQILSQVISEPFFSTLRTQQQTGYIVSSDVQEIERRLFAYFYVQSATHDTRDLLARFELFIEDFLQCPDNFSDQQFETIKSSMIAKYEAPPKNLSEMCRFFTMYAFDYDGNFMWRQELVKGLKELTYSECIDLAEEFLGKRNKKRLGILVNGVMSDCDALQYTKLKGVDDLQAIGTYRPR